MRAIRKNKVLKLFKKIFISFPLFIFNKYKRFAFGLSKFYKKVPRLLWGLAAVFGIFALGVIAGIALNDGTDSTAYQDLEESQGKYGDLIRGYEELSNLYSVQGKNLDILTDSNILTNFPEEYFEAYKSVGEYRDKIIFMQGRVSELRRVAGFFDATESQ